MRFSIRQILHSKVVQNSMWLFILQIANTVLPLLTIPYVTRILGAAGYGEYTIAYNLITYCQVVVEYGFVMSGARRIAISSDDKEYINSVFSRIITARAVLFIISLTGVLIVTLIRGLSPSQIMNVLALMIVVFSVIFQMNWLYQGMQQMRFITIVNVIGRLISVGLIFAFIHRNDQVFLYCIFYSFTFIISSLVGLVIAKRKYRLHYSFPGLKGIISELKDGWHLFTSVAVSRLFGSIGVTILGIYATVEAVGGYSAVYKVPYIMTLCFSPIGQALYPYMSKSTVTNREAAIIKQKRIFVPIMGVFILMGIAVIVLRNFVVKLLLGSEYLPYSNLIIIMIPQMLFGILNNFLGVQSLVASGHQKQYSRAIIISVAVLLVANFIMCPTHGIYGTALAALISEVTLSLLLVYFCKKNYWLVGEQ